MHVQTTIPRKAKKQLTKFAGPTAQGVLDLGGEASKRCKHSDVVIEAIPGVVRFILFM